METMKLTTRIDQSGVLRLELPSHLANQDVEVLVVVQPVPAASTPGWPADYFAAIDAIEADDMVERPDQYAVTG